MEKTGLSWKKSKKDITEFYKVFEEFMVDLGEWFRERFPDWIIEDPPGEIVFRKEIYECGPAVIYEYTAAEDHEDYTAGIRKGTVCYALSEEDALRIVEGRYEDVLRGYLDGLVEQAKNNL